MKKKITAFASTLTASTVTAGVALINQFVKKTIYRSHIDNQESQWDNDLGFERIKIKNHKGMHLQGYLLEKENATHTLLCLHPLFQSSYEIRQMKDYFESVYDDVNLLFIDANAHGLSDGYIRGLGYRDIFDLMYFNTFLLQKYGENHHIIMYGKGMGANTILNTAGLNKLKNVDCIISEGAYDNVYDYLAYLCSCQTKVMKGICGPLIRQMIKKELNLDIKKMDTVKLVKKNTIPTVFIHSKEDENVPFSHVFPLYNHNASLKLLFPIKEKSLYDLLGKNDSYSLSLIEFMKENK